MAKGTLFDVLGCPVWRIVIHKNHFPFNALQDTAYAVHQLIYIGFFVESWNNNGQFQR
jgi:hypothetical protein